MKKQTYQVVMAFVWLLCSCSTLNTSNSSGGSNTASDGSSDSCALTEDTSVLETNFSCDLLDRDASACEQERIDAGFSGYWLKFSCRVTLSMVTSNGDSYVQVESDGQPDYKSNYFDSSDACYDADAAGNITNPNQIEEFDYAFLIPLDTDSTSQQMDPGAVGVAINGVPIFDDRAAQGDDIYEEEETFDVCQAHPTGEGAYHYHSEPYSISYDDDNFIGVMLDGYPVYGRKDSDGTYPTLDDEGGHTGVTVDSPDSPVYHYHVNEQTSTNEGTAGETAWFITMGTYHGTPGTYSPALH